jgi:hypothetical protein
MQSSHLARPGYKIPFSSAHVDRGISWLATCHHLPLTNTIFFLLLSRIQPDPKRKEKAWVEISSPVRPLFT